MNGPPTANASASRDQRGSIVVEYLVVVIVTLGIARLMGPPLGKLAVEQYTARRAILYSMYP